MTVIWLHKVRDRTPSLILYSVLDAMFYIHHPDNKMFCLTCPSLLWFTLFTVILIPSFCIAGKLHADLLPARTDWTGGPASPTDDGGAVAAIISALRHQSTRRRVCGRTILDRDPTSGILLSLYGWQRGKDRDWEIRNQIRSSLLLTQSAANTVKLVLKDCPIGHKNVVSQDMWSWVVGSIWLNCRDLLLENVVLQDWWSLIAVVSQGRFHCINDILWVPVHSWGVYFLNLLPRPCLAKYYWLNMFPKSEFKG